MNNTLGGGQRPYSFKPYNMNVARLLNLTGSLVCSIRVKLCTFVLILLHEDIDLATFPYIGILWGNLDI